MGLFNTSNATLYFHGGIHRISTPSGFIGEMDFDAIVLEWPGNFSQINTLLAHTQYRPLVKEILENPKPIFCADLPPPDGIMSRELDFFYNYILPYQILCILSLKKPPYTLPLALPFLSLFLNVVGYGFNSKVDKVLSYLGVSNFFTWSGFRSALAAWKIDEFIVPEIEKRCGRKPTIFIEYGKGHSDMVAYLQHRTLRNLVLFLHRLLYTLGPNRIFYPSFYFDRVGELRPISSAEPYHRNNIISRTPDFFGWERIMYNINI